jgi:hypothetical protein
LATVTSIVFSPACQNDFTSRKSAPVLLRRAEVPAALPLIRTA